VPVPVLVAAPGVRVIVHVPVGSPPNTTLPVATEHVGEVIVPIVGADGVTGWVFINTFADPTDVHPDTFVTVKLYVPAASPVIVVLEPFPVLAPGFIVQSPEGRLLSITLPVASSQVGCVIVPTAGAEGVIGCAGISAFSDKSETQPDELVTVKLYILAASPEIVTDAVLPAVITAPG
jgi:hypothetical protein